MREGEAVERHGAPLRRVQLQPAEVIGLEMPQRDSARGAVENQQPLAAPVGTDVKPAAIDDAPREPCIDRFVNAARRRIEARRQVREQSLG
ncbi:MAG: hypothetical protein ACREF6_06590, partial [Alphaproteobacteria bacterium]